MTNRNEFDLNLLAWVVKCYLLLKWIMKIKNIFIVEDNLFFASTFSKGVRNFCKADIHHFTDCKSALDKLLSIKPEIIFLDHLLNGIDGVDALPMFVENLPSTDVVVISSQKDPEVLKRALEFGAKQYFQKDALLLKNCESFILEKNHRESKLKAFWLSLFNS